jgi:hypothetical protein
MQGRSRLPPLAAIREHRLDIRRQQRRIVLFGLKARGTRVRNLAPDDRGESLIDEREVFEHAGNGPAIGSRHPITQLDGHTIDRFTKVRARAGEARQYFLESWMHDPRS